MSSPRKYRIRIQGDLDPSWSGRLGGMTIDVDRTLSPHQVVLTGSLPDQSALTGVINSLVDLRQLVLSVETLES